MTSAEMKELTHQYVMNTYGRFDVAIDHGEGCRLYDPEGREYIDLTSGIGVTDLGYGYQPWVDAIAEQAKKLNHVSNLFYTEPAAKLAQTLCQRTGMSNVFFANGGGEANEGMIKLARKYSFDKYGAGRYTIITLKNSFHGRTITTLKATGQDVFHNFFFPFTEGFRYAEANNWASLEEAMGDDVCAVMVELVQGEGGVLPLDYDYVHKLKALCDEKDLLLLADEVHTGIGRTGKLFAFQQYDILPDVVSFAKGIAGGLPMSGIMANEKCKAVLGPGTHATTFGGNPIAAAGALAVLEVLDDDMLAEVNQKGAYLREQIAAFGSPYVETVRGMGLMVGIVLKEGVDRSALVKKCYDSNLLVLTAGPRTIRLLPPLVISQAEMDIGLAVLKDVLGCADGGSN
jgi:acetylornithine/N-succinyldiaminopimelate aminotransferase